MPAKTIPLPNVKKFFIPDPGYVITEWDLSGADARVVAHDSCDEYLIEMFNTPGMDIHSENAKDLFGAPVTKQKRHAAKQAVHATNYFVQANTLSQTLSTNMGKLYTKAQAQDFINNWYELHPGIQEWHERVQYTLQTTSTIYNAFGYRRIYFERMGIPLVQAALAWIPQSTVGLVINKGWLNIRKRFHVSDVRVLAQIHDSLLIQIRSTLIPDVLPKIKACMEIPIPYNPPLTIPIECKLSHISWGDCKDIEIA